MTHTQPYPPSGQTSASFSTGAGASGSPLGCMLVSSENEDVTGRCVSDSLSDVIGVDTGASEGSAAFSVAVSAAISSALLLQGL
jgi:hypothetical protein